MRTYGQYCPIARAAEILAERWTPLIVRNIHAGCGTFGEILAGAPGLSHTLLTQRLRHLIKAGIITTTPKASGCGVRYQLTDAGDELWPVLLALGAWGERWVELRDEHTNPRFLLWTWATTYLAHANLPNRRVVVRFEFADRPDTERAIWLVVQPTDAEVCLKPPGYPDDLVVQTTTMTLAKWHTGQIEWADALRSGQIGVTGPRELACTLPTWNLRASTPWNDVDARPVISTSVPN
ncbi:MAG TPA: helix-turn-helix domain-containing protein [Candidatus Limnocylindrales bacterium]|nr:helix-turn-helix domain-containing protein [Candidatus Limnocylindrales bacterium]